MSVSVERPVHFNSQMVRATLEGRKTVTRMVVKGLALDWLTKDMSTPEYVAQHSGLCPYGQPGDRLWVREAWAEIRVAQAPGEKWVVYRECDNRTDYGGPWKPSIHMRRRDSRILLEITSVGVERLQDISYESARAEGVRNHPDIESGKVEGSILSSKALFECLWCDTYGDDSWFANPWVWVINFKQVSR